MKTHAALLAVSAVGLALLAETIAAEPDPSLALGTAAAAQLVALRYAPYAEPATQASLSEAAAEVSAGRYWRTPQELRAARASIEEAGPLDGLRLVLDPGHIGGAWASLEGREFRVATDDLFVREGELVLEVARRAAERLEELGAEVQLTREGAEPVNPKPPEAYLERVARSTPLPDSGGLGAMADYGLALRERARALAAVEGELVERARLINESFQPDAVISLHINAAPWPKAGSGKEGGFRLVDSNHSHVLIFGCVGEGEIAADHQRRQTLEKIANGSGAVELALGAALGRELAAATGLPASQYNGRNAVRILPERPEVWARNLMMLRTVRAPTVLTEPYIANGREAYARIQEALAHRAAGEEPKPDDILIEYTEAVVRAVRAVYE